MERKVIERYELYGKRKDIPIIIRRLKWELKAYMCNTENCMNFPNYDYKNARERVTCSSLDLSENGGEIIKMNIYVSKSGRVNVSLVYCPESLRKSKLEAIGGMIEETGLVKRI